MLDQLSPRPGSRHDRKRKGRGVAAGQGRTCGRGQNGAGSRSGFKSRTWYEGGQMPLARRLPKRGFHNLFRTEYQVVNLGELGRCAADSVIDAEALAKAGLISRADDRVKILGEGDAPGPLQLLVDAISAQAKAKLEAAGGRVELRPRGKGKASKAAAKS